MDALTRRFELHGAASAWLVPFPARVLVPFGAVGAIAGLARQFGWGTVEVANVLGVVGVHGGMLTLSLAAAWSGAPGWGRSAGLLVLCLAIGASGSVLAPWGGLAYLLPPLALAFLVRRQPELRRIGLTGSGGWRALALGGIVGGFLGGHLLLSASRTWGYAVRVSPPGPYVSGVLYDLGANVPSAECFFRGTLFNGWQRRWGFWRGALAATGLVLLRYLFDPALPRTLEAAAGAVFYLSLLSLSGCALLWYSGSLGPSMGASLAFFSAYRMLQVR